MRKGFLICISLASASLVSAQTDSNSITVVASRNASLQADQAVFGVAVTSGLNASFEDVLGALQGSGLTLANFTGVSTPTFSFTTGIFTGTPIFDVSTALPPNLQWSFTLPLQLSTINNTIP